MAALSSRIILTASDAPPRATSRKRKPPQPPLKLVYPVSKSEIDKPGVTCVICSEICLDPTITPCLHAFCQRCITDWVMSHDTCAACTITCDIASLRPMISSNPMAYNMGFRSMQVYCPFYSQPNETGELCSWKGDYTSMLNHELYCPLYPTRCSNFGCHELMRRSHLIDHESICEHRSVVCSICKGKLAAHLMDAHQSVCKDTPVHCDGKYQSNDGIETKGCGARMKRSELMAHCRDDCLMSTMVCSVPGCKHWMLRRDESKHNELNKREHTILGLKRLTSDQAAEIHQLKNQLKPLAKNGIDRKMSFLSASHPSNYIYKICRDRGYYFDVRSVCVHEEVDLAASDVPIICGWQVLPRPIHNFGDACASLLVGNTLYTSGGYDSSMPLSNLQSFNEVTRMWTNLEPMKQPRYGHAMVEYKGNIYVIGGKYQAKVLTSVEIYNIATNTWEFGVSLNQGRMDCSVCAFNGRIYVLYGSTVEAHKSTASSRVLSVEMFLHGAPCWMLYPDYNDDTANIGGRAVVHGGVIWLVGGYELPDTLELKDSTKLQPSTAINIYQPESLELLAGSDMSLKLISPCPSLGVFITAKGSGGRYLMFVWSGSSDRIWSGIIGSSVCAVDWRLVSTSLQMTEDKASCA
jgi:hypothetical protein